MTHDFGNPSPGLGQALKCGGIQVNGIPTLHFCTFNKSLQCHGSKTQFI
jgi:hypothetical protein